MVIQVDFLCSGIMRQYANLVLICLLLSTHSARKCYTSQLAVDVLVSRHPLSLHARKYYTGQLAGLSGLSVGASTTPNLPGRKLSSYHWCKV